MLYSNGGGMAGANSGYENSNALWVPFALGCIGLLVILIKKKERSSKCSIFTTIVWLALFTIFFTDGQLIAASYTIAFLPIVHQIDFLTNKVKKMKAVQITILSTCVWFLYMYSFCYPRSTSMLVPRNNIAPMYIGSIGNFFVFIFAIQKITPEGGTKQKESALDQTTQSIGQG
jgi:hypothetical protein